MTTRLLRPAASVTVDGTALATELDGDLTLDEGWSPYCQGTIAAPFSDPAAVTGIDPRAGARAVVSASLDGGAPRTFDLSVRTRTIDYEQRIATLTLATDEALLQDYAVLAADTGARAQQASIRGVVGYVLNKIGATLQAGTPDADVTAQWGVTNMHTNPSFEIDLTGWSAVQLCTVARYTSGAMPGAGAASLIATVTGAGDAVIRAVPAGQGPSVTPGRSYVWAVYSPMNPVVAPQFFVRVHWMNNAGQIVGLSDGARVNAVNGVWTRAGVIAAAPAGATRAELFFIAPGVTTNGHTFLLDGAMFYEGTELVPYFDGATAADARYTYSWGNAAHAGPSSRKTTTERPPDLFTWKPGTTAWDFLQPLITATGLRLFCDEKRVWRLVDSAYTLPQAIALNTAVATDGSDLISREDPALWAQGVVARYVWEDVQLGTQIRYDTAGTPGKVFVIDYAQPYPGPGAAARLLAVMQARGRTQGVVALTQLASTPGMESRITLPGSQLLVGRIRSVRFDLADARMTVASRQQTTIPPDSWMAVNPAEAWTDPPDITWNEW